MACRPGRFRGLVGGGRVRRRGSRLVNAAFAAALYAVLGFLAMWGFDPNDLRRILKSVLVVVKINNKRDQVLSAVRAVAEHKKKKTQSPLAAS